MCTTLLSFAGAVHRFWLPGGAPFVAWLFCIDRWLGAHGPALRIYRGKVQIKYAGEHWLLVVEVNSCQ